MAARHNVEWDFAMRVLYGPEKGLVALRNKKKEAGVDIRSM